ncbi:hypothetical protein [uncultured Pseudokineococcus sp.]|uniref:hypothetical protein n=1 Tax=uncultured Pseudokineococcus sp. TaxID=1642928 RepID=UPI0026153630|nr:hypothetical protein [uncultured Pseudokineococcus sp.]
MTEEPVAGAPSPAELVPVLGEPATDEDDLPTIEGRPVDDGLAAGSARRLGATERAEYWVALDDEGGVCLLLALAPGDDAVSRSCGPVERFGRHGTWVGATSQTQSAIGLLVPDGFDLDDATRDDDWVLIEPNLAVPADEVP